MKRISLGELLEESKTDNYSEQYQYVCGLLERNRIKEVKSSPLNGKTPALHQSYWIVEAAPDYGRQMEELKFEMVPTIRTDYYLAHMDVYLAEEKWVKLLNSFFLEYGGRRLEPVSLNERSFQIWGREKFLGREQGKKILAHCGVALKDLCVYDTTEPLAYYSVSRKVPQGILILENKDTFYSMRRFLLGGAERIMGEEIGTVVYGGGKGILRSFADFGFCVEPHIKDARNQILYFGDLDYEGVGIYERLERIFGMGQNRGVSKVESGESGERKAGGSESGTGESDENRSSGNEVGTDESGGKEVRTPRIKPFVAAYEKMLGKAKKRGMDFLPETSENQNRNISGRFFSYFPEETRVEMERILEAGKYIPQEIITITDLA